MNDQSKKMFYLATTGILAYVIADIIHEVIGHGGTCLIFRNKIELLTSVYFKSRPGNILVDIGGPTANLIFGILTFYILTRTSFAKLFFFQVTAYNLFWFSGTILHSAISKTGDWTYAIKEIISEPYSRISLITTGILFYTIILRALSFYLRINNSEQQIAALTTKNIFYSFLFAFVAAFVAGLFFQSDRLNSGLEGLLEMAGSLPIFLLKFRNDSNEKFRLNYYFGLIVLIVYLAFCLTLGKGIIY
ncbi:hypothetical protein [Rhizosphaericola mali]|uniref:Uncharacterized protein n=1 Tax=Rhizosphaericola mali TaxID=2545455 RepID=A0A5P2FV67_9BACT|nr:hypothetical protein [Rhizosphaericola mali]QES87376.1 hypothetical protein E0W69_001440 [Rhizosphaericola mali]